MLPCATNSVACWVFLTFTKSTLIAVVPADTMQHNEPLPGMPVMTEAERRGLAIYISEGCVACHTQQVRNIEMDYVKPDWLRVTVQSAVVAALVAYLGWTIRVLWGVGS